MKISLYFNIKMYFLPFRCIWYLMELFYQMSHGYAYIFISLNKSAYYYAPYVDRYFIHKENNYFKYDFYKHE